LRLPRLVGWRNLARCRGHVEQDAEDVDPGHAVDQRVVRLRHEGEAPLAEPLHQPQLPEWFRAVETLREDAAQQRTQLLVAAGRGQRAVPYVVVDVERRVVDPERPAHLEARPREALAVTR